MTGEVLHADNNAAANVLARMSDPDITRFMPYKKVKEILLARTEARKSELTDLGSSYTLGNEALTECEIVV